MKLFKVYGQNCVAPHPYKEIFEEDLEEHFNKIVDDALDCGIIEFTDDDADNDRKMSDAYDKVEAYFEENDYLNCGDYMIVRAEDLSEVRRPNMCGYDTDLILG